MSDLDNLPDFGIFDATPIAPDTVRLAVGDDGLAWIRRYLRDDAGTVADFVADRLRDNRGRADETFAEMIGASDGNGFEWISAETAGFPASPWGPPRNYVYSDEFEVPDDADPFVGRYFYAEVNEYDDGSLPTATLLVDGYVDLKVGSNVWTHLRSAPGDDRPNDLGPVLCDRGYDRDSVTDDPEAVTCPECAALLRDLPSVTVEVPVLLRLTVRHGQATQPDLLRRAMGTLALIDGTPVAVDTPLVTAVIDTDPDAEATLVASDLAHRSLGEFVPGTTFPFPTR